MFLWNNFKSSNKKEHSVNWLDEYQHFLHIHQQQSVVVTINRRRKVSEVCNDPSLLQQCSRIIDSANNPWKGSASAANKIESSLPFLCFPCSLSVFSVLQHHHLSRTWISLITCIPFEWNVNGVESAGDVAVRTAYLWEMISYGTNVLATLQRKFGRVLMNACHASVRTFTFCGVRMTSLEREIQSCGVVRVKSRFHGHRSFVPANHTYSHPT